VCSSDLASARDFDLMENVQIALLEGGADTAAADQNGDTALHYAARNDDQNGAKTLCEMLLEFGAAADAVNNAGKTALDIAAETNNEPLVKLLLAKM
jgi:ankyrin repeat protein